jgi:hypothetical protein
MLIYPTIEEQKNDLHHVGDLDLPVCPVGTRISLAPNSFSFCCFFKWEFNWQICSGLKKTNFVPNNAVRFDVAHVAS